VAAIGVVPDVAVCSCLLDEGLQLAAIDVAELLCVEASLLETGLILLDLANELLPAGHRQLVRLFLTLGPPEAAICDQAKTLVDLLQELERVFAHEGVCELLLSEALLQLFLEALDLGTESFDLGRSFITGSECRVDVHIVSHGASLRKSKRKAGD
jgi:hypothetical protein